MRIILGVAFMVAWIGVCSWLMEASGFVQYGRGSDLWATIACAMVIGIYAVGVYGFVQIAKERN